MSLRLSTIPAALMSVVLAAAGTPALAAAQAQNAPKFHPNSEKYSDVGAKPATGRSGSASLESRALLDKEGTTLVEATTGSLETGTAPGQIRKMQVKVFGSTGKLQFTENAGGTGGGAWSAQYPGLGRNQVVQLQANVGGIDGNRNDVVTVSTQVKRRPDIAVDAVTAPAKALAGALVNVVATVSEKNGDVGARATCMLSVDGASVLDQADGIWVDAGHTVSCAFQTRFSVIGRHDLTVYATSVMPADWDLSNNAATTTIEILSPETPMNYSAGFSSSDYDYKSHYRYSNADGTYLDEKSETGTRRSRALSVSSWTTTESFVFPMKVRTAAASGGATAFDITNDFAYQINASWTGADCSNLFQDGLFIGVCNYTGGTTPRSQVDVSSYDGRVTYFGSGYFQSYGMTGYAYNYSSDVSRGFGGYPVGSSVSAVVELTDARGKMFVARPTIALVSTPIATQYSSCFRNPRNGITYCSDGSSTGTSLAGSASDSSH